MSYNKYNTRNSGRFNTPGHFVSGGEFRGTGSGGRPTHGDGQRGYQGSNYSNSYSQQQYQGEQQQQQQQQQQYQPERQPQQQQPLSAPPPPPLEELQMNDTDMKTEPVAESNAENDSDPERPQWMKKKGAGVKKISKKERRRRQNQTLRRLLSPKNAIMALNEMMPTEQVTNQFKVEGFVQQPNVGGFCADLTLNGQNYKGYGDNKMSARNAAAEQALRDHITKQLSKISQDGAIPPEEDDEPLPMIQLASFALHKLFSEWEQSGHRVPQLKPNNSNSVCDGGEAGGAGTGPGAAAPAGTAPVAATKPPRPPPLNAAAMHPSMLLTYMRPRLEWRDLAADGDRPQNMQFTMGVDVDGSTYIGKASNKKEARRLAARAACEALFGVQFDAQPTANVPVTK